jgi:hypothetical protein
VVLHTYDQFVFHDGIVDAIDGDRMVVFETQSMIERHNYSIFTESNIILDELGPAAIDFADIHEYARLIPDINEKSARLFTIWVEDADTSNIVAITKGHIILHPFDLSYVHGYYQGKDDMRPFYPKVLFTSFRTVLKGEEMITSIISQLLIAIEKKWKAIREYVINKVNDKELKKRYILSFDNIIYFTFLLPSIENEVIRALQRKKYQISGIMQILSARTSSYNQAVIDHHVKTAVEQISQLEE